MSSALMPISARVPHLSHVRLAPRASPTQQVCVGQCGHDNVRDLDSTSGRDGHNRWHVRRVRQRLRGRCDHDGTANASHIGEPDGGTEHSTANLCGTDECADDGATILATDSTPNRGTVDPRANRNESNVAHKRTVNTTTVGSADHQPNRRADNSRTHRIPDHRIVHNVADIRVLAAV
jgi:hypothetical protein